MSGVGVAPQIARIARLLGVGVEAVQGLEQVPVADLRVLHDQISETIHRGGHARFAAIATLATKLPGPVAARLAEKFLPPVLAARVCEHLDPSRACDLVARVGIVYLGDVAVVLDPVRSRPVVEAIPAPRVAEVGRELFARREYGAMAEFVNAVTVEALSAVFAAAAPRDLAAIIPLLEWSEDVEHVMARLPARQLAQLVTTLTLAELTELVLAMGPSRFGPIIDHLDADTLSAIGLELEAQGEQEAARLLEGVAATR